MHSIVVDWIARQRQMPYTESHLCAALQNYFADLLVEQVKKQKQDQSLKQALQAVLANLQSLYQHNQLIFQVCVYAAPLTAVHKAYNMPFSCCLYSWCLCNQCVCKRANACLAAGCTSACPSGRKPCVESR